MHEYVGIRTLNEKNDLAKRTEPKQWTNGGKDMPGGETGINRGEVEKREATKIPDSRRIAAHFATTKRLLIPGFEGLAPLFLDDESVPPSFIE